MSLSWSKSQRFNSEGLKLLFGTPFDLCRQFLVISLGISPFFHLEYSSWIVWNPLTRNWPVTQLRCPRTNKFSGAAYPVRPARPRPYLDFEKEKAAAAAAARRHYRGLTWLGRARRAAHCSESRQKVQKESKIQCLGSLWNWYGGSICTSCTMYSAQKRFL